MVTLNQKWEPKTFEDKLILNYSLKNPGTYYLEVSIGSSRGNGNWPKKSGIRRIDAINIMNDNSENKIFGQTEFSYDDFQKTVSNKSVELIEAKKKLNRLVIGQVIAGYDMFEREYDAHDIEMVILCGKGDPALEWVCEKRNIKVEILD
ncbi:MAG: hypothetical protein Q8M97_11385 [Methanobacteriaceae archaeon]|nr:hypothetical protein [Methanobacteriaceae archaeon]